MKISDNFSLKEFTNSETATKRGFSEQWNPSPEIIQNLKDVALNTAELIRTKFGSFSPTVGYRCKRTNTAVGGASNSEHLYGNAFDETFIKDGVNISREVFDWIIKGGLPKWSKIILEYPDKNGIPRWLHIGYDKKNLDNIVLVAEKNMFGKTVYTNFYQSKYFKK